MASKVDQAKPATEAAAEPAQETMPTVEVVLLAPHEHKGRVYPKGAKITLHKDDAEWLVSLNKAQPVDGK